MVLKRDRRDRDRGNGIRKRQKMILERDDITRIREFNNTK